MRYRRAWSRSRFADWRACGVWLAVSALLLVALLAPPLLLPLLLVLPVALLILATRLAWVTLQLPLPQVPSRPFVPRGPPQH